MHPAHSDFLAARTPINIPRTQEATFCGCRLCVRRAAAPARFAGLAELGLAPLLHSHWPHVRHAQMDLALMGALREAALQQRGYDSARLLMAKCPPCATRLTWHQCRASWGNSNCGRRTSKFLRGVDDPCWFWS